MNQPPPPGPVPAGPHRTMIIAKMVPDAQDDVARLFAESDATDLPHAIGVQERSLYALGDCYVHLVEFDRPVAQAMAVGVRLPGFSDISRRLEPFISPYLSTWRSPADAQAHRFYTWRPTP